MEKNTQKIDLEGIPTNPGIICVRTENPSFLDVFPDLNAYDVRFSSQV
jgi:hypothetical protein